MDMVIKVLVALVLGWWVVVLWGGLWVGYRLLSEWEKQRKEDEG